MNKKIFKPKGVFRTIRIKKVRPFTTNLSKNPGKK